MALEFRPPEWLLQEYMNRERPIDTLAKTVGDISQQYTQQKAMQQQQANQADEAYIKAFEAGGPELAAQVAKRRGIKNPVTLPSALPQQQQGAPDLNAPTEVEEQAQMSMPEQHPQMSPLVQAWMNRPQQGKAPGYPLPPVEDVNALMNQGKYGQKKIDEIKKAKDIYAMKGMDNITPEKYAALQSGDPDQLAKAFPEGIPQQYVAPSLSATARNVGIVQTPTGLARVSKTAGTPAEMVNVPGVGNTSNPLQSKLNPNEYKDWVKETNDFTDDPVIKADRTMLATLNQINTEIAKYNPSMTGPLKSQQARAIAREVGALTDSDIARQALDPSMLGRLKSWASIAATGEIPEDQLSMLKQTVDVIQQSSRSRIATTAKERAARKANLYGGKVTVDELMGSLKLPTQFSVPSKTTSSLSQQEQAELAELEKRFGGKQ